MSLTVSPITRLWTLNDGADKSSGTTVYRVKSTTQVTPATALSASGLPLFGDAYPGRSVPFICVGREARCVDDALYEYVVTCSYETRTAFEEDPLAEDVRVSYSWETAEEAYFLDQTTPTAKRAVNTAGQPFSELPKRDSGSLVITVSKNVVSTTNYSSYVALNRTVNSGSTSIDGNSFAAGTLYCQNVALSEVKQRGVTLYRELVTTFRYSATGFDQNFESRGFYTAAGVPIADASGVPTEVPWPLDSVGGAASNLSDTPATVTLKPYAASSFSSLV